MVVLAVREQLQVFLVHLLLMLVVVAGVALLLVVRRVLAVVVLAQQQALVRLVQPTGVAAAVAVIQPLAALAAQA
jgi:hypothetical protein